MKNKTKKQKTFKIRPDWIGRVDWDYDECFNSFLAIIDDEKVERFIDLIASLYDNKRVILAAEQENVIE